MQKIIQENSEILAHIDIKLMDGSVADSSRVADQPFKINLGQGDFSDTFEGHLYGMRLGEKRQFILEPQDAYGMVQPQNYRTFERQRFATLEPLETGMIIELDQLSAEPLPAILRRLDDTSVVLDFNHPLAGQRLEFSVEVLAILR